MLKVSIRKKLLALCILLVLLTTVSTSVAYYILTKQDKHRESQQRIQIAFDIILDDIATQFQLYTKKFDEFLQRDTTFYMALQVQDTDQVGSQQFIISLLSKTGYITATDRLTVYSANKQLIGVYQRDQKTIETESSGMSSVLAGDIPDTITASLFSEGQKLGIRITAPVSQGQDKKGVLLGDVWITQNLIARYAALSKTEVNFFAGKQFSLGTLPAQQELGAESPNAITSCQDIPGSSQAINVFPVTLKDRKYYQGRCAFRSDQKVIGAITVSLSQEIEKQEVQKIVKTVFIISVLVLGIAFGLSVFFSRKTLQAIYNIVRVISAASTGDLRPTELAVSHDEIGMLAVKLNQMITQLRTISGQVQIASQAVGGTADTILRQMETLTHHIGQQSASVDSTTDSIEKIKQFIDTVAQNTTEMLVTAEEILSAIQETRSSIEEVTTSTGSLTTNLHLISSSVEQVNQSVKQIADNTGQLEEVTRHTETEIQSIDQSLRDVSHNADQVQQLAKETMDAATSGQVSVDASLEGMIDLKKVVANTAQIIQEVSTWGEQVSSILDMVDEITEQTSLLALNASIISAQAGVHGRGFAVVADEIKSLATRTKSSTKEIGTLVHELQKKTEEGVDNIAEGLNKADQSMQLAQAVKEALHTILERATHSSSRASDTAKVIQQTADSSQTISTQMNTVTAMVSKIRAAIQEEKRDIEQVVAAVENIGGMSEQVSRSSSEQKRAADQIATRMEAAIEKFSAISEQTEALKQDSDQIVLAMRTIATTSEQSLQSANDIARDTVKNFVQQAEDLQQIVKVFKVT